MHCIYEKFPLAPMGVLAPLSVAQSPITLADIFWRMCLQSNLHHFFFKMQNFGTLRQPLLWFWIALVTPTKTRGKIPKIVATFVYASSQGQRTHSARTKSSATHDLMKEKIPGQNHLKKRSPEGLEWCRVKERPQICSMEVHPVADWPYGPKSPATTLFCCSWWKLGFCFCSHF